MSMAGVGLPLMLCAAFAAFVLAEIRSGIAGASSGIIRRSACAEGFWIAVIAQAIAAAALASLTQFV